MLAALQYVALHLSHSRQRGACHQPTVQQCQPVVLAQQEAALGRQQALLQVVQALCLFAQLLARVFQSMFQVGEPDARIRQFAPDQAQQVPLARQEILLPHQLVGAEQFSRR